MAENQVNNQKTVQNNEENYNDLVRVRREKLAALQEAG